MRDGKDRRRMEGVRKRVEETLFSPAIRVRVEEGVKREKKKV